MPDPTPPRDGPPGSALEDDAAEIAVLLDALMAEPIKGAPKITVVGDDDVAGINPPPPRREP